MRIKTKFKTSVMAVALATIPFVAHAAGMGRLNVLSGLGQPLHAEIDLVSVQPNEAQTLRAGLASQEAFHEAQIDYPSTTLGLRFNLDKRANGQYFIAVYSAQSINEPFLDFLVELKWDGGRVLREYTALLDPVGYSPANSQPVRPLTPAVGAATPSKAAPAQAAMAPDSGAAAAPIAEPKLSKAEKAAKAKAEKAEKAAQAKAEKAERAEKAKAEKAEKAEKAKADKAEAEAAKKPEAGSAEGDTYAVKPGDTLAGIAHHNQVEGVSLEQMLVALYQANQDAFDGNMNRLKTGKILKLPGKDAANVEQQEAVREIHAQAEDWRSYRSKLAETAGGSQPAQAKDAGAGKITAKVEDKGAGKAAASSDKLTLSKGDEAGKLKERVRSLEEDTTAKQKALSEANQRVADLEKTNKKLEDLLALKSKQGADMQKQAEAQKAEAAAKAAEAAKKPEPVQPTPTPVAKPIEAPKASPAPMPAPAAAAKPGDATKPAGTPEGAAPVPVEGGQQAAQAPVATPAPATLPKPKPKKKPVVQAPAPEPEESLMDNPFVLGGGLLAVLGLGGGGFWYARRRKKNSFEDSIITGSDLKSNTMVGNTGGAVISTGVTENSFLTDFSRAGLGTIDTDEVDPIAEAEVYMAYGRDAQAEEILKDALARDGSRQEVRLKLLEIYNTRKNVPAFEALAREMYSGTQGQGPLWQQAAEMGRALDPQNTLYQHQEPVNTGALDQTMVMSAGTLGVMAAGAMAGAAEPEAAGDLDFQLDMPQAEAAPALDAGSDMDFDLGIGEESLAAAPAAPHVDMPDLDVHSAGDAHVESLAMPEEAPAADLAMDFDLGSDMQFDAPAPAPASVAAPTEDGGILSLDIPLDLGAEAAAPAHEASAPGAAMLDLSGDAVAAAPMPEMAELDAPDLAGGLDFDFDLGETPAPAPAPAAGSVLDTDAVSLDLDIAPEASSGDVMDFGAELDDPVTTKIDLARAYIDMGDKEGAREILQEALHEGTADQKSTAESLLAQL